MREDLAWTYTLAGSMNTFNAVGYLIGALITPRVLKRWGVVHVLISGSFIASLLMALTGFFSETALLLIQRLLAGLVSAVVFVSGGLLAARLGAHLRMRRPLFIHGSGLGGFWRLRVSP